MILSCGEALIDFVPSENLQYTPRPGGSPYNFAIAVSRLGVPAGFLGKISEDFFGDMLLENLASENVDISFVKRSKRLSTLAFVKLQENAEPRYAFYCENTADRNLAEVDIPVLLPAEVKCVEFGSISLLLEPAAGAIKSFVKREAGKRAIAFDPNIRPLLITDKKKYIKEVEELAGLSTIVKVSSEDLNWLYPERDIDEIVSDWLAEGAGTVVVTLGEKGAFLKTASFSVNVPGINVDVSDTIGAGDTFHAAFLAKAYSLGILDKNFAENIDKDTAEEILGFAVKAAGINCSRVGADPPALEDMERFS